jgi:hypothetical protein
VSHGSTPFTACLTSKRAAGTRVALFAFLKRLPSYPGRPRFPLTTNPLNPDCSGYRMIQRNVDSGLFETSCELSAEGNVLALAYLRGITKDDNIAVEGRFGNRTAEGRAECGSLLALATTAPGVVSGAPTLALGSASMLATVLLALALTAL